MKKIIFSAMALVLGLFTVTALFAFTSGENTTPQQGETMYYIYGEGKPGPDDGWDNPDNWTDNPGNLSCPGDEVDVCRINLEEGEELEDFLEDIIDYDDLLLHDQVDLRDAP